MLPSRFTTTKQTKPDYRTLKLSTNSNLHVKEPANVRLDPQILFLYSVPLFPSKGPGCPVPVTLAGRAYGELLLVVDQQNFVRLGLFECERKKRGDGFVVEITYGFESVGIHDLQGF